MELTEKLKKRLMGTSPAQLGHYIEKGYMNPDIKPISPESKIVGPAFTVKLTADDSVTLYYAMERAPKGSVIVIDRGGDTTFACCGEIVVNVAKSLGISGIVVDGPATDSLAIKEMGFPVFSKGLSVVTTRFLGTGGEFNIPISCGGVVINSGDIIFGDADGVIALSVEDCIKYIDKAEADDLEENEWKKLFMRGKKMSELCNIDRLVKINIKEYIGKLLEFDK